MLMIHVSLSKEYIKFFLKFELWFFGWIFLKARLKENEKSCMLDVTLTLKPSENRKQIPPVSYWWLVRVTLVVDWRVLPQNFGPVVGTYEELLQLCTFGGDCTCRWRRHLTT